MRSNVIRSLPLSSLLSQLQPQVVRHSHQEGWEGRFAAGREAAIVGGRGGWRAVVGDVGR
eukprot:1719679-Prymnesium_polylepis.2